MADYLVNSEAVQNEMLKEINQSWESLFSAIPWELLVDSLAIESGKSELSVKTEMLRLAHKNKVYDTCFLGAGSYKHFIPAVVDSLANREEFLTAYTPYQAELSQGILQSIFEYQTMICQLTGLDVSNASVYDGATACAEAVNMCKEKNKSKMLVASTINPWYLKTIKTYFQFNEVEIIEIPQKDGKLDSDKLDKLLNDEVMGVLVQSPNYYGVFEDCLDVAKQTHDKKATFVLCANPLSFALSANAKELEADICVGDAQPFGMNLAYGGPYLGFMSCTTAYMRRLPGRIVGQTVDKENKTAYVLTLQAREQHIKRERASSSICSNQANCALRCAIYLATVGPKGLKEVARQSYQKTHLLADKLNELTFIQLAYKQTYFHEFVTKSTIESDKIIEKLLENDILPGLKLSDNEILWCATECNSEEEIAKVCELLKELD